MRARMRAFEAPSGSEKGRPTTTARYISDRLNEPFSPGDPRAYFDKPSESGRVALELLRERCGETAAGQDGASGSDRFSWMDTDWQQLQRVSVALVHATQVHRRSAHKARRIKEFAKADAEEKKAHEIAVAAALARYQSAVGAVAAAEAQHRDAKSLVHIEDSTAWLAGDGVFLRDTQSDDAANVKTCAVAKREHERQQATVYGEDGWINGKVPPDPFAGARGAIMSLIEHDWKMGKHAPADLKESEGLFERDRKEREDTESAKAREVEAAVHEERHRKKKMMKKTRMTVEEFTVADLGTAADFFAIDQNADGVVTLKEFSEWEKRATASRVTKAASEKIAESLEGQRIEMAEAEAERSKKLTLADYLSNSLGTAQEFEKFDDDKDGALTLDQYGKLLAAREVKREANMKRVARRRVAEERRAMLQDKERFQSLAEGSPGAAEKKSAKAGAAPLDTATYGGLPGGLANNPNRASPSRGSRSTLKRRSSAGKEAGGGTPAGRTSAATVHAHALAHLGSAAHVHAQVGSEHDGHRRHEHRHDHRHHRRHHHAPASAKPKSAMPFAR
jgi:hypothetical protein